MPEVPAAPAHDDSLCRRCGKCCYKKIIVGRNRVRITPFPCEYLDPRTNLCRVYPRRHEFNRHCLSVAAGLKVKAFPSDCPYVAACAPPGYDPAREDWSWMGQWDDFDELADLLDVPPATRERVRERGPHAPPEYAEVHAARRLRSRDATAPDASLDTSALAG